MKKLLLFCLLLCLAKYGMAQNGFENKTVQILAHSDLTITGVTNINSFTCGFTSTMLVRSKGFKYKTHKNIMTFENAVLILNNQGFDCGNKAINKDFHSLLQTKHHPEISMELIELILENSKDATAKINISIAGKNKIYSLPVAIRDNPVESFSGTLKLNINDFDLKPPKKLLGLIVVKEDIEISFNLGVKN